MNRINFNCTGLFLVLLSYNSASKIIKVSSSEELRTALFEVSPGDQVSLLGNTTFHGTFTATRSGLQKLPITILTENFDNTVHARIQGNGKNNESIAALTIIGDHYNLDNIKIINNHSLGLFIQGRDATLTGVLIQAAETAVRITGARSYMKDCYVSDVESGIQIEGDFSIIRDTFVTGNGIVSVVAEKETCCGTLMENVFDGKVDIKGTDYNLFNNLIEGKSH